MSGRASVLGLLLSLGAGACAQAPDAEAGGPQVLPLGGNVFIHRAGEVLPLEEGTVLSPGDRLVTGDDGRALMKLTGGRSIELAPRGEIRLDAQREPEVMKGSALAHAAATPLAVQAGDADIEAKDAVFRIDRDFTVTLAVYQGRASLLGTGVPPVPELRQATVVAGGAVPRGPQPLSVRPNDPWDTELLGPAIDIGLDLVRLERGLTRQLPPGDVSSAVVNALAGDFPRDVIQAVLQQSRAAEAVVAAAVARYAARLGSTPVVGALNRVLELRSEGAHWIVVVATWELARTELLRDLGRLAGLIARFVAPTPSTVSSASAAGEAATSNEGFITGGFTRPPGRGGGGGGGAGTGPTGGGDSSEPAPSQEQPPAEDPGGGGGGGCSGAQCVIEDVLPGGSQPQSGGL